MSRLNGWHRIFVVTAILWSLYVYFYGNRLQGNYLYEIRVNYYVAAELEKVSTVKPKKSEIFDPYAPYPYRNVTMPDGVVVSAHTDHKTAEVEKAYEKAQPTINAARRDALQDYLIKAAKIFFLPLFAIYLLGWSVGWIRQGFRQSSSGT
jgi:hypothetical protein